MSCFNPISSGVKALFYQSQLSFKDPRLQKIRLSQKVSNCFLLSFCCYHFDIREQLLLPIVIELKNEVKVFVV